MIRWGRWVANPHSYRHSLGKGTCPNFAINIEFVAAVGVLRKNKITIRNNYKLTVRSQFLQNYFSREKN